MKVCVLGAGAVGSMLGGLLQRDAPEVEVVLVARGEHGRAMAERGRVRLDGPWGSHEVRITASENTAAVAGSRFVLVTVKSQDTESAARAAVPHWGDATVVSIQNGINDHRLAPFVEPDRLVMGTTATNMALIEPGRVSLQLGGATIFGSPAGRQINPEAAAIAAILNRIRAPALRFQAHPNALGIRYNKLAINAIGYASAISASNVITEALAHQAWRQTVGLPIVWECRRTFQRAGILVEPISGVPNLRRFERLMRLMNSPMVGPVITFGARRLFDRRPIKFSLQQDLERRKPTEVAYVNGEVVRMAESMGTTAPANRLVVDLVRELEERADGTFFTREDVIRRFGRFTDRS